MELEAPMDSLGLCWVETGEPVQLWNLSQIEGVPSFSPLTGPDMFDQDVWEMSAIRFDHGHVCEHIPMELGGRTVVIWKPTAIIDDQTLDELNVELGFVGMQEEIYNLEHCKTGRTISEMEMKSFCKKFPSARSSPRVAAFKSAERVRTRIVAKDFNRGQSARSLGFSSPTPSIEALHLILAISATRRYLLRSLDVSHACMHSPLGKDMHVVLKLPLSVSLDDGQPAFLVLDKALNGLRDASLCWLQLLSETVKTIGLWTDSIEPCVYSGAVYDGDTHLGHVLVIVYVDDILLASSTEEAEAFVVDTISKVVPTKTTGQIPLEGGSLTFIGRIIQRVAHGDELLLSINPSYLDSTFKEYGIDKGSDAAPDVASHLEKTMTDENAKKPLSSEAYGRFRRALGKLLWMSQVRHDLKTWLSIIGCHQASPMSGTEAALRSVLRFLKNDMHVALVFPTRDPSLDSQVGEKQLRTVNLHCFSDASFAPYRFNKRRGISGGCVFFERSLVRSLARQQHALSLSSCESELYALQSVCQESVAFGKLVHRLLFSIEEMDEPDPVHVFLESDSSSALQLVKALDIPKKSRHVEIRLLWLREQLNDGQLFVCHRRGESNPADLFTKCLQSRLFFVHRFTIGLVKLSGLLEMLAIMQYAVSSGARASSDFAIVEVCCSEHSSLRRACEYPRIPYVGITAQMQSRTTFVRVRTCVQQWEKAALWVHVHASTPCSSGSPLRNFSTTNVVTAAEQEWPEVIEAVRSYLSLGHSASFELPQVNSIWSRPETKDVLLQCGLTNECFVRLCRTGSVNVQGEPIGKTLKFASTSKGFCTVLHRRFGVCTCKLEHAAMDHVDYPSTASYTKKLARGIVDAVRGARRDP